jgi:hypothetical protein
MAKPTALTYNPRDLQGFAIYFDPPDTWHCWCQQCPELFSLKLNREGQIPLGRYLKVADHARNHPRWKPAVR